MKKSFMTRVLAVSLSAAMAFSLSTVSNLATAEAAASTASLNTTFKTLKVGQSYRLYLKTNRAAWKVKTVKSADTSIVTAVKADNSAATLTGVGVGRAKISVNLQTSKRKTNNKKTLKCTVKVVEQTATVDTTGQAAAIDSAEAKGAKKITVKFNKALEAVPAKDKVTVTRGNSKKTVDKVEFSDDTKTSVDIYVATELTKGNYNVSIEGINAEALKAEVVVAEDEVLTSYEIFPQLISDYTTTAAPFWDAASGNMFANHGMIYYRALNQYGEPMNASTPRVSTTFGTVAAADVTAASTTEWGHARVTGINNFLMVPGSKGTVVLVDPSKGVNKTAEIEYARAAAPTELKFEGVYNTLSSKMIGQDLPSHQNANSFYLLYTGKTQYECVEVNTQILTVNNTAASPTIASVAGGVTNIAAAAANNQWVDIKVDGKEYVALKLQNAQANQSVKAGTATVTVVNNSVGSLVNHTVEVKDSVVVNSFTITTSNLYDMQKNEVDFQAIDSEGNAITDYATLKQLVSFNITGTNESLYFERQADGTAKLIYDLSAAPTTGAQRVNTVAGMDNKNSIPYPVTVQLNDVTSAGNFKVSTYSFTLNEQRIIKKVLRVDGDKSFTVRNATATHKIANTKIVYADQYGNEIKDDDIKKNLYVNANFINRTATAANDVSVRFDNDGVMGAAVGAGTDAGNLVFNAATASSTTVYLKYWDGTGTAALATTTDYDYKFVVTAYASEQAASDGLKIDSVNDGNQVDYRNLTVDPTGNTPLTDLQLTVNDVKVTVMIAGETVTLPTSQYKVIGQENSSFTADDIAKGVLTKTATVIVRVTTWDANHNESTTDLKKEYTVSKADPYTFKVDSVNAAAETAGINKTAGTAVTAKNVTKADLVNLFVFKDQYGNNITDADIASYEITVPSLSTTQYSCVANGTNAVVLELNDAALIGGAGVTVNVKATVGSTSKTATTVINY